MNYCRYCMSKIDEGETVCPHCGADLNTEIPTHHLVPGTILHWKFLVGAALGEGGFGITYIGRDMDLDLKVAIKEYYPNGYVNRNCTVSLALDTGTFGERKEFFEKGKERFLSEARTLAKFADEPGIVTVRDFFEDNGTAYIVMEYLDGDTLKDHLSKKGCMAPKEAVSLLLPVMQSLQKVHEKGLIHRDISPDNIMLKQGRAKLLDFGAARNVSAVANHSLSIVLKPGYAPEEQYRSRGEQGPWTDIYALCATIYKCITGITPDDSTQRVYSDEVRAPSELGIAIDPMLENALMKGMAVSYRNRYQRIEDLVNDFQKALKGERNERSEFVVGIPLANNNEQRSEPEEGSVADGHQESNDHFTLSGDSGFINEGDSEPSASKPEQTSGGEKKTKDSSLKDEKRSEPAKRHKENKGEPQSGNQSPKKGKAWLALILAGILLIAFLILLVTVIIPNCGGGSPTQSEEPAGETVHVTGIQISKTELSLDVGDSATLSATVLPENATNKSINWESSDPLVATVDENGVVSAMAEGSAVIIAASSDGGKTAVCPVQVKKAVVNVEKVGFSDDDITLTTDSTYVLHPVIEPENATDQTVTWSTSDSNVAAVDENGQITAVGEGTAKITVTTKDGEKTAACTITVKKAAIAVSGIELDQTNLSMETGESATLKATIKPDNATNRNVNWESSDTSVAMVADGKVTAIGAGTAEITATTSDGNKTAKCSVTVKAAKVSVSGVSLNATSIELTIGGTYNLTATVSPGDATDKGVSWKSSDASVAAVDNGKITAKLSGKATITVTTNDGKKTAQCVVTVKKAEISVSSVSLNTSSLTLSVGKSATLSATVNPSNATNKTVYWQSSNSAVATVSNGVVTGKAAGIATITVTTSDGGKTAKCTVTIKADVVKVSGVSLNTTSISLGIGETYTLSATVSPGNATDKTVSWTSSNTSVATVSNGVVTGKTAGTATITVTTNDGGKTAKSNVVVKADTVNVTGVGLSAESISIGIGESYTLSATVSPSNATNKTVSWKSSNTSVATVSNGVVTGKAEGTATISAITSDGNKIAKTTVTILNASKLFEYNGHIYRVFYEPISWSKAKEQCERYGGHLATITSSGEQQALESQAQNLRCWLGGYAAAANAWKWITGESWTYTNWLAGEPNGYPNEACLAMWPKTWNDLIDASSEIDGFICEWDTISLNGHAYFAYSERMSWTEAKRKCEQYGGYLATITSSKEQKCLEWFQKDLWIGGYASGKDIWHWVTGEEWSYTNWLAGEPNGYPTEAYLAIWPDTWNDLSENSTEVYGFICEWKY